MDWDDARIFLAVAEAGTLTGAAGRLGLSQPTVGRRLQALERRLTAHLFQRTGSGLRLTPAGAPCWTRRRTGEACCTPPGRNASFSREYPLTKRAEEETR